MVQFYPFGVGVGACIMLSTGQSLAFGEYLPLINAAVLFILVIKVFFWAAPKRTRCYDEALGALVDMHGDWYIKVMLEDELTRLVKRVRNRSGGESETGSDSGSDSEFDSGSETVSESETGSETVSEYESETGSETGSDSVSEYESDDTSESEFRLDSESESETRAHGKRMPYCSCHKCNCSRCLKSIENGCPYGCGNDVEKPAHVLAPVAAPAAAHVLAPAAAPAAAHVPVQITLPVAAASVVTPSDASATDTAASATDTAASPVAEVVAKPTAKSARYVAQRRRKVE